MMFQEDRGAGSSPLEEHQCFWLLEQKGLGRVAVSVGALPAVFPVSYEMLDGDIFFLTGEGTKLAAAVRRTPVAFEVDEFDVGSRCWGWSVLAVGHAEPLDTTEMDSVVRELSLLQRFGLEPRNQVIRVRPEFLSGQRIDFP